jgi:hypothetical protein
MLSVVSAHPHYSDEFHFERKIFHGGSLLAGRPLPLVTRANAPVHLPGHWVTNRRLKGSGARRIVRAAGDAKDHERVGLTFVPTHQDDTAISAFAFDRRIKRFQHWRRLGHRVNDSGAGTTLRAFCRKAGIAVINIFSGNYTI